MIRLFYYLTPFKKLLCPTLSVGHLAEYSYTWFMRKHGFAEDEFYHVYNRGVEKRNIFMDDNDRWRFITLLMVLQGKKYVEQIGRYVIDVRHLVLDKKMFKEILQNQTVKLVGFCLMPNHFHLILQEVAEGGISAFMQRLGDGYTKYFNARYQRHGHLFGGVFKSVHIDTDEYMKYLSAYIHLNPSEAGWRKREVKYPWSSFQDYVSENRWKDFLDASIILNQFDSGREYKDFVMETDAGEEIDDKYLLDNDKLSNT